MTRFLAFGCLLAAAMLAQASCGGGGSRDTSLDVTINGTPVALLDGLIYTNGITPTPLANSGLAVMVGDYHWPGPVPPPAEYEVRGYVTFNIAALPPPPAVVRDATLMVYYNNASGTPFANYGNITIDHVDVGPVLDTLDFNVTPITGGSAFATVATSATPQGYVAIDVRAQIGADQVAGRTNSSFRLRFTTVPLSPMPSDGQHDAAQFEDTENNLGTGNPPVLTIRYSP